jgi:hypothetical protein
MRSYATVGIAAIFTLGALSGCGEGPDDVVVNLPPVPALIPDTPPAAEAGVPPMAGGFTNEQLIAMRGFTARTDPFALLPAERVYETEQRAANLVNMNGWSFRYEPAPEVVEEIQYEEQPYRRLAGILIGETVVALLDMGDGRIISVRPGQRIEGTDWFVASIDQERLILRRVPESRVQPREVEVRLGPAMGRGGGQPGQGGAAGGAGGAPGSIPPGAGGGGGGRAGEVR